VKTRASLFDESGFRIEEIDVREPGADEVVVRMRAVGICGSDLHVVKGEWPRPTPIVLGHEGAGEIVGGPRGGERVVLSWAPSCGACGQCRRGRPAACGPLHAALARGTLLDGSTGLSFGDATVYRNVAVGAFAEHVVVPSSSALALPDAVTLEQAALLGCAALTGVGAVLNQARVTAGSSVLVVGAGAVGQFAVQGARLAGAEVIVAVDPVEARQEQVRALGATHVGSPDDLKELVRSIDPEGLDYAFDAVGFASTSALALRWTRGGGTCVIVGMAPAGQKLELDPYEFTAREKTVTGSVYGSADPALALPALLEHVAAGRIELASLLGPSYPLEETAAAVDASLAGSAGRVLVTP
jgi:S-(hydroxymethyl)glutathione dehydrogenase/alcohol dehydrogenase